LPADIAILIIEHDMGVVFRFAHENCRPGAGAGSRARINGRHIRRSPRACGLSRQIPDMTSSLEVGDLVSGWGRTVVLNGVSLTATPGSTLAVLGRNGAGKTTLLQR
jgi:ABC-type branched-subunit amino acid transport system ATPase component